MTISLEWTAPPDPAGAPVLGYVVQYALIETPGSWNELKETERATRTLRSMATLRNTSKLDAGRTYRYRVAAYNQTMKVGDETVYDPNFLSGWASPDAASTLKGPSLQVIVHDKCESWVTPSEEKIFLYWPAPQGHPADPMGDPVNAYQSRGTADY